MSKIELDDQILDHPKFVRAVKLGGSDAVFLWLGLRSYCSKLLTDGFIPDDMLDEVRGPKDQRRRNAAMAALKSVNLIEDSDGGVRLHDYLDWASSRDDVMRWRAQAKERQAKSRAKSRCDNQSDNDSDADGDNERDSSVSNASRVRARVPPTSPSHSASPSQTGLDLPPNPPGGKRTSGLTKAPESIEPTEATLAVSARTRRDWRADWQACRDWAWSGNKLKADWQATLRNWMTSNAQKYGPSPGFVAPKPKDTRPPRPSPAYEWIDGQGWQFNSELAARAKGVPVASVRDQPATGGRPELKPCPEPGQAQQKAIAEILGGLCG